jgi:hypothetical protein
MVYNTFALYISEPGKFMFIKGGIFGEKISQLDLRQKNLFLDW